MQNPKMPTKGNPSGNALVLPRSQIDWLDWVCVSVLNEKKYIRLWMP